jgi:hypothetical protein
MPHTREQRDRHALCGAKRKNGEACRKFAGEGTSHPGVGRCKYHLGNTKDHQTHAVKVEAQRRAIQFGQPLDIEPVDALLAVLHLSCGHMAWLRNELAGHEDKTTFEASVLMRMWDDERDRVARISKAALDAGVQERSIQLAERYGEMLAQLLRSIFYDPELGMTKAQHKRFPAVARRHLVPIDPAPASEPPAALTA